MTEIPCEIIDGASVGRMNFLWTQFYARIFTGRHTRMAVNKKRNRFEIMVFRCAYSGVKIVDRSILQFSKFTQHYAPNKSKRMPGRYKQIEIVNLSVSVFRLIRVA